MDAINTHLAERLGELTGRLKEWVAIPSIAGDPEHRADLARSAHWLAGEMRDAGLEASVVASGDSWAVLGELAGNPDAPTVLVYSHHDVRTVKPEEWRETAPFVPVERDGRLYGRGASDAKAQALAHVWALRALLAVDAPAPVTSMRGTVNATLTVHGPDRDVHSGVVAGATVNPATTLARALAALHDDAGRIAVPGFYDDVAPLTDERRAEFAALPFDEQEWTSRTETRVVTGEEGYTAFERLWARPTIEVMSLLAGTPSVCRVRSSRARRRRA